MSGSDGGSEDAVLYEATAGGVAVLTFNRPERLNVWGPDIATGFYAAIDRAEQDPAIRVIVLTGRGRGFCAGAYLGAPSSAATYGEKMDKAGQTNLADLVGERPPHCYGVHFCMGAALARMEVNSLRSPSWRTFCSPGNYIGATTPTAFRLRWSTPAMSTPTSATRRDHGFLGSCGIRR